MLQNSGGGLMKRPVFLAVLFTLSFFLHGSGCTKIETPLHDGEKAPVQKTLVVVPEKETTFDTEPVRIEAQGYTGMVTWKTEPSFSDTFFPETGSPVVFTPPDISSDMFITLIARDDTESTAEADLFVIDEGEPPAPGDILINEIAWAGSLTSAYDEYIELINLRERDFYLAGWRIENASGSGSPLVFSGRISSGGVFLIANYHKDSPKTAITGAAHIVEAGLSLPNSCCGPFVLKNTQGVVFDTVGDGEEYDFGMNESERRASMARYTDASSTVWDPRSWYTEGACINLSDGTFGTPGAANSDTPLEAYAVEDAAEAIITEYRIDANEGPVEDWVELLITKSGNMKHFTLTDLDGDSDSSVTGGEDVYVSQGEYVLVIWSNTCANDQNRFFIQDVNPTGTKDELVLLCCGEYMDCLCYYSTEEVQFDDRDTIKGYGWNSDPLCGKHASRVLEPNGLYASALCASSWNTDAEPTPGAANR